MAPEALVTAKNVIAFIFMPTLCFQLTYPRTKSINYISLATWTFKMTIGLIAFYYMISHQFVPVLEDVLNKIEHDSIIGKLRAVEFGLKSIDTKVVNAKHNSLGAQFYELFPFLP